MFEIIYLFRGIIKWKDLSVESSPTNHQNNNLLHYIETWPATGSAQPLLDK